MNLAERFLDRAQLVIFNMADKFQRDMQIFGVHPASTAGFWFEFRDQFGKRAPNAVSQIERDKQAHRLRPAARRVEEIAAHGIERGLRGVPADAFAVARELEPALSRSSLVGDADVHQSHGFFRRAAAGPGDAGDADAERRAGDFANSVGQREGHFRADRAFRFDQLRRDADERRFRSLL